MRPSGYTEAVSVTEGPPSRAHSVATLCDFRSDVRFKETVDFGTGLRPVRFQSRVVCHATTSKKNFRSSASYVPRLKPVKYEATRYVQPKRLVTTYVTYLDYVTHDDDKWYTTCVHFAPSTARRNTVRNIQMRGVRADDVTTERPEVIGNGAEQAEVIGNETEQPEVVGKDVNMNVVKDRIVIEPFQQPPLLISSGPDDVTSDSARISHRTRMVVKSAPTQRMHLEDYVVYLNGYSGDVTENGYALNDDVHNGYSSDDDVTDV